MKTSGDVTGRRRLLILVGSLPLTASWLAGCKRREPASCQDIRALAVHEQLARAFQQYTDRAPSEDTQCQRCDFWLAPDAPGECGACRVVRGPIHPRGYCTAFAAKT